MHSTVKKMAEKLAGVFYEDQVRSPKFRMTFPTLKAYMRGQWHQPNGDIVINKPGYLYHVEMARKVLAKMLTLPDTQVHANIKDAIYQGFLDEHEATQQRKPKKVLQRQELH